MIKCLLIDDEPLALQQLVNYVSKVPDMVLAAACHSTAEARKVLENDSVDVLFVDINMPDENGMDFVKSLENPPAIVFTTAYSEYAVEGFKVGALDYLLKPFGQEDFNRVAEKVRKHTEMISAAAVSALDSDNSLFFKTDYKIVRVELDKIIFIEGMSEYLKIHIENSDNPIIVLMSMKKLEERLASNKMMRIHKSYIINLRKIEEVSKSRVLMTGGASLPIGDLYRDTFMKYLDSKFMGK